MVVPIRGLKNKFAGGNMADQKQLLIRFFEEVWNQRRAETIDELFAPDCVIHDGETDSIGPEGFKPFFARMSDAFSEIHVTPLHAISEGDVACLRWSVTMRHTGGGLGMPPTGKVLKTTGISIVRFANGKFAEGWQNWDMLGMMHQISGMGH